jgi:ergothioneine biosynthesis protein EgtB
VSLAARFAAVRAATVGLCQGLAPDDYGLQSMPEASPPRWHLGHTTWFFETFVLAPHQPAFRPREARWLPLFNSYYLAAGPRFARSERGLLSRPTLAEVLEWRAQVDAQVAALLEAGGPHATEVEARVELGIQHEQQHQELLLTDLLHAFSRNPLGPALRPPPPAPPREAPPLRWLEHPGGLVSLGHRGAGFAFDNEGPAHQAWLAPYRLASRLVTVGEYLAFLEEGGYRRGELWLSDGFAAAEAGGWKAPLYWEQREGGWERFTLHGWLPLDPAAPVCHLSFYEADAFARWAGLRLAAEQEWEAAAAGEPVEGQFVESGLLTPRAGEGMFGGAWAWTASPYVGYPGYRPPAGALGEYNGKFMVNQQVLRGGSCLSPRSHLRATYRNFFPPQARWQMTGIRLAQDA